MYQCVRDVWQFDRQGSLRSQRCFDRLYLCVPSVALTSLRSQRCFDCFARGMVDITLHMFTDWCQRAGATISAGAVQQDGSRRQRSHRHHSCSCFPFCHKICNFETTLKKSNMYEEGEQFQQLFSKYYCMNLVESDIRDKKHLLKSMGE